MDPETQKLIDGLESRIKVLEDQIRTHNHGGNGDQRIEFESLIGMFAVVSAVPTYVPKDINQQIVIYKNGATYRLYWHDGVAWRYATGT